MILPVIVFIVVLVIILLSFKTEHFQAIGGTEQETSGTSSSSSSEDGSDSGSETSSSSSSSSSSATDDSSTQVTVNSLMGRSEENTTYLSFIIDVDPELFSDTSTSNLKNNLSANILSNIINSFNVNDFDINIQYDLSTQNNEHTEVLITISDHKYTDEEMVEYVQSLEDTLFGGIYQIVIGNRVLNVQNYTNSPSLYIKFRSNPIETDNTTSSSNSNSPSSTSSAIATSTSPCVSSSACIEPTEPVDDNIITTEKLLSKKSCVNTEEKCNIGYKPYSYLELEHTNPDTERPYLNSEKTQKKKMLSQRCSNEEDSEEQFCCDKYDTKLNNVYSQIPGELRRKFRKVVVDKCNNKLNSIKVCDTENENCEPHEAIRPATAYELCKLQNITDDDINDKGIVNKNKLMPDCYDGKCEFAGKLLELHPEDKNIKITNHYYLIDAVKNNNIEYVRNYFGNNSNSVDEKLEYGYPGNTILHQAVYDEMDKIVEYLLTENPDLSITNKDGNTAFHIACFKGNYNGVHRLIKLGASVNCGNSMNDTPLHCAVRSGSYNTVLILLNNGASAVLEHKNEHGETPLHTAVVSKKKNLKVVELLVEYGSDVHNINKYSKTILRSLMEQPKTISRETIRTYLQRIYYRRYDTDEYNRLLRNFPEIRPFEIDTEIPEELEKDFRPYRKNINYKDLISYGDEFVSDRGLYVDKYTRAMKANIPDKYFDDLDNKLVEGTYQDDSFDTSGGSRNPSSNDDDDDDDEEFTEDNVDIIENFENSNDINNINISDISNNINYIAQDGKNILADISNNEKTKFLVYSSFYILVIFLVILIVLYLKRISQ